MLWRVRRIFLCKSHTRNTPEIDHRLQSSKEGHLLVLLVDGVVVMSLWLLYYILLKENMWKKNLASTQEFFNAKQRKYLKLLTTGTLVGSKNSGWKDKAFPRGTPKAKIMLTQTIVKYKTCCRGEEGSRGTLKTLWPALHTRARLYTKADFRWSPSPPAT